MTDTTVTNVTTLPKQSLKDRVFTKKNLKRGAIAGVVVAGALYVKSRLNGSASASVDVHVETDDSTDN